MITNLTELEATLKLKLKDADIVEYLQDIPHQFKHKDFRNKIMLHAYQNNRLESVNYLLNFFECNNPAPLLKIQIKSMLSSSEEYKNQTKQSMLKILMKNFSIATLAQTIETVCYEQKYPEHFYQEKQQALINLLLKK